MQMTKTQLQEALKAIGVAFEEGSTKAQLQALWDERSNGAIPHVVTEDDIKSQPELSEEGVQVGDLIVLPAPAEEGSPEEEKAMEASAEAEVAANEPAPETPVETQPAEPQKAEEDAKVALKFKGDVHHNGKHFTLGQVAEVSAADAEVLKAIDVAVDA